MVDILDRIYTNETGIYHLDRLNRFLIRSFANIVIPTYFSLTRKRNNYKIKATNSIYKQTKIIVSFTTFPKRINKIWLVLETIFRQSKKPDKVILWLSKKQFPNLSYLPNNLVKFKERGLDIRFVENDIKSHKKYYYTLKEFPNDIIITIDDDIFYRSNMIEDLYRMHQINPNSIIAQYTLEKKYYPSGNLKPYKEWNQYLGKNNNKNLFFGSGGGTLFPPNSLYKEVLAMDKFLKYSPNADDVWLNIMAYLNETIIEQTDYYTYILPVINNDDIKLSSTNRGGSDNDEQIQKTLDYVNKKFELKKLFNRKRTR